MQKEKISSMIDITKHGIDNCEESSKLRTKPTAFTRKGKLGAKNLLRMILKRIYNALQLNIDDYYEYLEESPVSKQAVSKARANLNPEYVRYFADQTAAILASDYTMPCYQGMRLIAIDGTDIALESTQELKDAFGCTGPKKDSATALASIAYGPLDHVIYDSRIDSYDKDERELARMHIERLNELELRGSLLLFDRWYPSAEFIAYLIEQGYQFVMRVRRKWNLDVDAIKTQKWIQVEHESTKYPVRVLKIKLNTGETETLLTTLNQRQLPIREAGDLYFKRWGIEVAYDIMKSKLQLENFSGKTKCAVLQDFYATVYLTNMVSACAAVADEIIAEADENKDLKYSRVANRNRAISKLRNDFFLILTESNKRTRDGLLDRLFARIARCPISVIKGRSPERKIPRKKRFPLARKPVV
jgi:hypothetical protein